MTEAGVDLLVIETQYDLGEMKAAISGARLVSDLPIVASFSYDRGKRTMMGVSPTQAAKDLENMSIDLIGINCGRSIEENFQNLVELKQVTTKPIWFKPNAGLPYVDRDGNTTYNTTPEMMGNQVHTWILAGALIVGGCCGTSPQHLQEISKNAISLVN
jgi:5-methyltetrahydrofolate--homocysteine methyltransferase